MTGTAHSRATTASRVRTTGTSRLGRPLVILLTTAWTAAASVACAWMLAAHVLTLPVPDPGDPGLAEGVRSSAVGARWTVLHALSSECRCSGRVLDQLFATARPAGLTEVILLVGPTGDIPSRAAAHGFRFESLTAQELTDRYSIPAVPLLVVADPAGIVRYSGGYTARKQGPQIEDLDVIAALREGRDISELPLYGCPVNTALKASIDPIGIR